MRRLDDPRLQLVIGLVFLLIVVGGLADLYLDTPESLLSLHVALEAALVAVSLGLGLYLLRGWFRTTRSLRATRRELEARSDRTVRQHASSVYAKADRSGRHYNMLPRLSSPAPRAEPIVGREHGSKPPGPCATLTASSRVSASGTRRAGTRRGL